MTLRALILALIAGAAAAADLTVARDGTAAVLSWPDDGAYRVPCWRDAADGEWIPVVVDPTLRDGRWVLALADQPAARDFSLRRRGAETPFTTYEAEADPALVDGAIVRLAPLRTGTDSCPELEASGRAFVELDRAGQHLDIRVRSAADGLVLRHCIPDAPGGGGTEATLGLYVNGVLRQKLRLSSRHAWLYGGGNGQSDDPVAGPPHVFWEEARARIAGGLKPGDILRLQRDADDSAAFYRLDLVDLEAVPPPLPPPAAAAALSVADFGAVADDDGDDTAAIQACIDAARERNLAVWLPPGTWRQSARLRVEGVALGGAGMWHTTVVGTVAGDDWGGRTGFILAGSGASVADLSLTSEVHTNRAIKGGKAFTAGRDCRGWRVENVWISNTHVGFWMSSVADGVIRGCRVRGTYADAINLNRGSCGNLVEGNHVRGCGDDGIALLSETGKDDRGPSCRNTVRGNTVAAIWWGHNGDLAGGEGNVWEDNLFADNSLAGVFTINLPGAYPMHPVSGAMIRRNSFIRGGGDGSAQKRGAVWIFPGSTTIAGVVFRDNEVRDPVFRGIHLVGTHAQSIVFERTRIVHPGEDAILIGGEARGDAVFRDTIIEGLADGRQAFAGPANPGFAVTREP